MASSGRDIKTVLDPSKQWPATAGVPAGHLQVQQELVAPFNPKLDHDVLGTQSREEAGSQQVAGKAQKGKANPILKGLKLALLVGTVLGLLRV